MATPEDARNEMLRVHALAWSDLIAQLDRQANRRGIAVLCYIESLCSNFGMHFFKALKLTRKQYRRFGYQSADELCDEVGGAYYLGRTGIAVAKLQDEIDGYFEASFTHN